VQSLERPRQARLPAPTRGLSHIRGGTAGRTPVTVTTVFSAPRLLTGPESLLLAGMAAIVGGALAARFGRWASPHARSAGTIAAALVASTLVIAPVTASSVDPGDVDGRLRAATERESAGVAAWIWLSEGNPAALGLFAVFGAAAMATKLEGVVELAIVLAVGLAIALRQSRRDALLLGVAGAVTLVGLVPWRLWAIVVDAPATYSAGAASDNLVSIEPSRIPIAALLLVRQLFDPRLWLVLVPVAICAFVVASAVSQRHRAPAIAGAAALFVAIGFATAFLLPASSYEWRTAYWLLFLPAVVGGSATVVWFAREGGAAAFAGASFGGMLAALVGIYLFTPYDFAWHLGTSSSRVVVPPALFAAVFAPIVLAGATARNAGRGSP
jgi:hypothetical protein